MRQRVKYLVAGFLAYVVFGIESWLDVRARVAGFDSATVVMVWRGTVCVVERESEYPFKVSFPRAELEWEDWFSAAATASRAVRLPGIKAERFRYVGMGRASSWATRAPGAWYWLDLTDDEFVESGAQRFDEFDLRDLIGTQRFEVKPLVQKLNRDARIKLR